MTNDDLDPSVGKKTAAERLDTIALISDQFTTRLAATAIRVGTPARAGFKHGVALASVL